jgi:hypothetical protein
MMVVEAKLKSKAKAKVGVDNNKVEAFVGVGGWFRVETEVI